jgi:crotonobetainyl-CoA:carnitine CoA-transferase CaiB-like acyl-CoA transferase
MQGVTVLDLTHAIFGALATRMLGDFGADVIKVENPGGGDFNRARNSGLNPVPGMDSARFLSVNYNKRSVAIDLKHPRGIDVLTRMIEQADVVIHNFRPQVAKKLGFDSDSVLAINPRVVYCSLSGYGETGPLAHRRGGDPYAQALTGVIPAQGSTGQPPYIGFTTWVDHSGAALAALGVVLALRQRDQTGSGQVVDTNLIDTALFCQTSSALADFLMGAPPVLKGGRGASGAFPWGAYTASDGDVVLFLGYTDDDFGRLCDAIGRPELASDERYDTDAKRRVRREELYALLDEELAKGTRDEWARRFSQHGVRCDPALTHEEMLAHPQVVNNEMIVPCPPDGGDDAFITIGNPLRLGGVRPPIRMRPPDIGEHTREVLGAIGYSAAELDELLRMGALAESGAAAPVS